MQGELGYKAKYEVTQLIRGEWKTIAHPADEMLAIGLYQQFARDHPKRKYQMIRVETITTVMEEEE